MRGLRFAAVVVSSMVVGSMGNTVAEGAMIGYSTYTPGDTSTYSTSTFVNLKSTKVSGEGGTFTMNDKLTVSFIGGYDLDGPLTDQKLTIPIRVNAAASTAMLSVTLRKGANVYGGGSISLAGIPIDGQFHEIVVNTGLSAYGSWTIDISTPHTPLSGVNIGADVDIAGATNALPAGTSSAKYGFGDVLLSLPDGFTAPAIQYTAVPEPAGLGAIALAGTTLLARRRRTLN
jgi:hypothetical protein